VLYYSLCREMFPREYLPTQRQDDSSTAGVFQCTVYTILYFTKCFAQSQQYQARKNYVVYYILMAYICQFQNGNVHFCSSTGVQMSSRNIHGIFRPNLFWPMNKFLLYRYFVQRDESILPYAAFFLAVLNMPLVSRHMAKKYFKWLQLLRCQKKRKNRLPSFFQNML